MPSLHGSGRGRTPCGRCGLWALAVTVGVSIAATTCAQPLAPAPAGPVVTHPEPVDVARFSGTLSLASRVDIARDPQRTYDLEAVLRLPADRWERYHGDALNLRHEDVAWWVRVSLANDAPTQRHVVLHVEWPLLDYLDVHVLDRGQPVAAWQVGDRRPFANRPLAATAFAFPMELPPRTTFEVVMRLDLAGGGYDLIPITLSDSEVFFKSQQERTLVLAGYFGAITAICIYVALLYLSTRERGFLYYVGYLSAFSLWIVGFVGFGNQYLWTDYFWWNSLYGTGTAAPVLLLSVLFATDFLETRARTPVLHRVMWGVALADLLPMAMVFANSFGVRVAMKPFYLLHYGVVGAVMFLTLGAAAWMFAHGVKRAVYLVVAWAFLTAAVGIYLFSQIPGWLPSNVLTKNALVIGSSLEFLLLSLAVGQRFNDLKDETLAAQRKNVALQATHVEELEGLVAERTGQLREALAENDRLARTDELTKLANRRAFNERLAHEVRRGRREQTPLTLCLADIDYFKAFNDQYGHLAGDEALRRVGACLSQAVRRPADFVFRFGGEEFALLLAGPAAPEPCLDYIEQLRQAVVDLAIPHAGHPEGIVTMSFGVVFYRTLTNDADEILLHRADTALYQAKDKGRNRVEMIVI